MKTNDLIKTLTPKERVLFYKNVIKNHKRKSLQKLFALVKKQDLPDKNILFQKIFNQKYSPAKDSLLRNEWRLLNNELELFLVKLAWEKELKIKSIKMQWSLLKIYWDRRNFVLLEQTWKKLYKRAKKERLFDLKIKLINLWLDYQIQEAEVNFDLYLELKTILELTLKDSLASMQDKFKRLELKKAFLERNLKGLNPSYQNTAPKEVYHIYTTLENDDFITYIELVIESYELQGLAKIECLNKALSHKNILEKQPIYTDLWRDSILVEASVALEYFLLDDYVKADEIYNQLLPHLPPTLPLAKKAAIYFNYFSNLIFVEKYDFAIQWFHQSDADWKTISKIKYKLEYSLCWAYIYLQQYEKALDLLLEQDIYTRSENDFLYAKRLISMIYYLRGDWQLAERELYNLNQKNRYKTPLEDTLRVTINFLYRHLQIIKDIPSVRRNNRIIKLQKEADLYYHSKHKMTSSFLYFRWFASINQKAIYVK